VSFSEKHERGTEIKLRLTYPPSAQLGFAFAKLCGQNIEKKLDAALRRFKQVVETGETPTTYGQSSARRRKSKFTQTIQH